MKDPYTYSTRSEDHQQEGPEGKEGELRSEVPFKAPSRASVRKVLEFSKAYEVLDKGDGSEPIDLIGN